MLVDTMNQRIQVLQGELQQSKQTVAILTEHLENAKGHVQKICGHIDELNYIISQNQVQDASNEPSKEQLNGQATNEDEKQTAQE